MTFGETNKDNRQTIRGVAGLPVELVLYDKRNKNILAGPEPVFIRDITRFGAGIISPRVLVNNHHLFYEPTEKSALLYLRKSGPGDSQTLSIQVYPKWYRLDDVEKDRFFYLGIEFVKAKSGDDISTLIKMTKAAISPGKGWLASIFSR